jgi:hypothetical protein
MQYREIKFGEVQNAVDNKLFSDNPLVTGNPDIPCRGSTKR